MTEFLKDTTAVDLANQTKEEYLEKVSDLRLLNNNRLAEIASHKKLNSFVELAEKGRKLAEEVGRSPLSGDIFKDTAELRTVRTELEALFGPYHEEDREAAGVNRSAQLTFLVHAALTQPSPEAKQAQGTVVDSPALAGGLPQPFSSPAAP